MMSSDKKKQRRRSFDTVDLLNVSREDVSKVPRSLSCDPTLKGFELLENPSILTEEELRAIMIKDCKIESEELTTYTLGGYMPIRVGQAIGPTKEYQIIRKLGWGQFSTVWLTEHRLHPQTYYAVKVMKSGRKYRVAGRDEVKILEHIKNQNPESIGYNRVIFFHSYFNEWSINGKHMNMLFDVMGPSLLDLLMKHQFRGIYEQSAKIIVKQILEGVMFLHEVCNVIHTDLKPENILIVPNQSFLTQMVAYADRFDELGVPKPKSYVSAMEWQEYIEFHGEPSSTVATLTEPSAYPTTSTNNVNKSKHSKVIYQSRPLIFLNPNIQIKIADLGNACWENHQFSTIIQTIQYRALEVILEAGYSFPADLWSVGCIAFEMCTGEFLFHPKSLSNMSSTENHLGLIWEALGNIPEEIVLRGRYSELFFDHRGKLKKFDFEKIKIWTVEDVLTQKFFWKPKDVEVFADFVNTLINPYPEYRATASMALTHKWITEIEN